MTKHDKEVLVEAAIKVAADVSAFAVLLQDALLPDREQKKDVPAEEPAKAPTYEEARAVLAEKARSGFRAEVKAILARHGVEQLSDVKDPELLATIVKEAEEI